jgi:c-di-GMP-binding flagellar brake protein YcgR
MSTKKTTAPVTGHPPRPAPSSAVKEIARRKEWRFELPLSAVVQGELPLGKKFQEVVKIKNISATGAFFSLEPRIVVGTKFVLIIDLPEKATDGKKIQLKIEGFVVRLEKLGKTGKKQGVAVRFDKEFEFITSPRRSRR